MPDPIEPDHTIAAPDTQHTSARSDRDETAASRSGVSGPDGLRFGPPAESGEVGTLGPYRVLKELGKGGMGAVYLALDTRLDRKLAMKVMLPEFAADRDAKERFLREAKAVAKINHDNVVTVYEADERDGVPYITMQFLQGYPLDEYLKNKGAPPLAHVIRIAREAALGLAAAHQLGLVHRDIKPANLWLEAPNGRVKVLDFGLAKPIGSDAELTKSGAVVGTPAYMSPEQGRGLKVDHRTDLFSLGAVMYRLCTGQNPFTGANVMAVLMALGSDDPTPVRDLNPNVPEALAQLIHQLLAKKPNDRPQTANDVAKRLRAILEQRVAPTSSAEVPALRPSADLSTSQPIVVNPVPHQPPIVVPMQITAQPESAFANLGADEPSEPTEATEAERAPAKPKPAPKKSGGKGLLIAAGAAVLLAGIAVAVVVSQMGKKNDPGVKVPDPEPTKPDPNAPLPATFKNTLGMEFVKVPKGTGWLGGTAGKPGDTKVEIPADFYLGRYEVTQGEWEAVMGASPCLYSRTGERKDAVKDISNADLKRFPVENVSWDECQAFLKRLNEREKESTWVYRFPTEAEWEYACRGGPLADKAASGFDYYFETPSLTLLLGQANFQAPGALQRPTKVGSYKPNALGLYDMHGNVHEWCGDEYESNGASHRCGRGGAWTTEAIRLRVIDRGWTSIASFRNEGIGLRVARVPVSAAPPKIAPPAPGPVGTEWVDLLALDEKAFEVRGGSWEKREGKWTAKYSSIEYSAVNLPLSATGSYTLSAEVSPDAGASDCFAFALPIGPKATVAFGLNYGGSTRGFSRVKGFYIHEPNNPTSTPQGPSALGRNIKVVITVGVNGDRAELSAVVDNDKPIQWTGAVADLSMDDRWFRVPGRIGFMCWNSKWTVHALKFQKIDGEAAVLAPNVLKPWVPPAAVPVGESPFDKLDPKEIPAAERFDWQPKELVAVAGTHSPRTWTHQAHGTMLALSPDGTLVATGGQHSPLRVWDLKTRKLKADLPGHNGDAVTFSPDGRYVLATNKRVRWDLTAPPGPPENWPGAPPEDFAHGFWASPDGARVVVRTMTDVSVRDGTAKPAREIAKFPLEDFKYTFDAAVTPDVTRLVRTDRAAKRVVVHDLTAPMAAERWRLDAVPQSLALSADGKRLVTAQPGVKRRLWDLTAEPPTSIEFGTQTPSDPDAPAFGQMAFSPDGKRLVTQDVEGALHLWDLAGGAPKEVWTKPFPVFGLGSTKLPTRTAFAGPGGNTLVAFTGLGLVHFIDVSGTEPNWLNPIEPTEPAGGGLAFEGTTGRVALTRAADQRYQWWDFGRARPAPTELVARPRTYAFSPDGATQLAWKGDDRTRFMGGRETKIGETSSLNGTFAADGRTYWSFVNMEVVRATDVSAEEPKVLTQFAADTGPNRDGELGVTRGAFDGYRLSLHRNETVLACLSGGKLAFWDVTAPQPRSLSTFPVPLEAHRYVVLPNAEGVLVWENGVRPQLWRLAPTGWVKAWDADALAATHWQVAWTAPEGTRRPVNREAAHPSGQLLAVANEKELALVRTTDGVPVKTWPLKGAPQRIEFAPDGRHLFIVTGFNTIYVLRLNDLDVAAVPGAADRKAAGWVLSVGGKVMVKDATGEKEVAAAKDLPVGPFIVLRVNLNSIGDKATDTDMARLKGLVGLTALSLDRTAVSDAGMAHLKELPELSALNLGTTKVTDAGITHLKEMGKLTFLGLAGTEVTDQGIEQLGGLNNLIHLDVNLSKVTKEGVAKLAKALPKCKIVWTGGTIEPTAKADADRKAAEWVLSVGSRVKIKDAGGERDIPAAKNLPAEPFVVTEVYMFSDTAAVTDANLARFKGLTALTIVNLHKAKDVSDAGIAHLKESTGLKYLDIAGTKVTNATFDHIKTMTKLDCLSIHDTQITDAAFEKIAGFPEMTRLYLGSMPVADERLRHLVGLTKLTNLYLTDTGITDGGLEHLARVSNLTLLKITGTKVTADGVAKLAKALPKCQIQWDRGVIEPKK